MTKTGLIISFIINVLLLAIGIACVCILDFSVLSLSLFLVAMVFVAISSMLIWQGARNLNEKD